MEEYVRECIERSGLADAVYANSPIQAFQEWAVSERIRFIASEQRLYSKTHWIAGTADLIFEKDGKRYVGDVKTYKKLWDRVPVMQCAGYALMWEEMNGQQPTGLTHVPPPNIDGYCIINLPKEREFNPSEDVMWSYDTEGDTEAFLSALRLYRYLNNK